MSYDESLRPRFHELVDGFAAMSKEGQDSEYGRLMFAEMISIMPPEYKPLFEETFTRFFGKLPAPARRGENGEPLWTDQQLADFLNVDVREVRQELEKLERLGVGSMYRGKTEWNN